MIISSQLLHSCLTAGTDRALRRYGQLGVFESMKTAPRASLTTTGATNHHAVCHAWGRGTVSSAPVRPATTAHRGTVSSAPVRPATTAPKKRRTGLIALLVILVVMLIGLVSCGALIGTAGKAITEGTTGASQSQQAEDDRNSTPVPSAKRDEDPYVKLRGEPGFLSRADFGKRWPLTVEAGVVSCEQHSVIFMDPEGKRYAVNGTAMAHYETSRNRSNMGTGPEDSGSKN
jgi:Protein of unknown function (DUF2511)